MRAFNIKMVRECYYMMQLMEQQDFTFTQDDKRLLLRGMHFISGIWIVCMMQLSISPQSEKKSQEDLDSGIIEQYSIRGKSELQGKIVEYIISWRLQILTRKEQTNF